MLVIIAFLAACSTSTAPATAEGTPEHEGMEAMEGMEAHVEPAPAAATPDADGWSHYGSTFTLADAVPASALMADPTGYVGKTVRVEGKVSDVCQKAGCWMIIADGDKTMRVRMKDHAFSVDKTGAGCTASIEGTVVEMPIDPATVAHFEGESAKPEVMPEHAAVDGKTYEIEATGVAMKRS